MPSERVRSGYESLIGRFLPQRRDDNGGTMRCRGGAEPEVDHTGVQLFEQLRLIEILEYQRDLRMVASQLLLDGTGYRKRSEEHTSELQSQSNLVCRLLLEKKKKSA